MCVLEVCISNLRSTVSYYYFLNYLYIFYGELTDEQALSAKERKTVKMHKMQQTV